MSGTETLNPNPKVTIKSSWRLSDRALRATWHNNYSLYGWGNDTGLLHVVVVYDEVIGNDCSRPV